MRNLLISGLVLVSGAAFGRAEDRQVPAFSAVGISSGMRAKISIGPQRPVHIEADADVLPLIETVVEDGALQVRFKRHTHLVNTGEIRVTIQTPRLESLSASGGSVVHASFTKAESTSVAASGGSELELRGIDANHVSVQASGGSIVEVSGSCDQVSLQLSGGSQLHGRSFSARDATVQASGGSQTELKATGRVTGALSGGSQLNVSGGARAKVATSGGSEFHAD